MAILHKNISAEGDIHNPKWFSGANNGDVAWRNELGVLESTDELVLPAALDFVDGSVAPPTSNSGDIYVLSSGASVNAGWGTVSLGDWVRYDGTTWNVITPQKSSLCYNETTDALNSYDGSIWSAIGSGGGGGDSIYTANGTLTGDRTVNLNGNKLTFEAGNTVDGGVIIDGSNFTGNQDPVFTVLGQVNSSFRINEKGFITNSEIEDNNILKLETSNNSYNLIHEAGRFSCKATDFKFIHPTFTTNYVEIDASRTRMKFFFLGNAVHDIMAEFDTNFYQSGFSSNKWISFGSSSRVSTEDISLQGSTLIKGNGTSTGSALAIYNNDTTPFKLWDFLDNGRVIRVGAISIGENQSLTDSRTVSLGKNVSSSGFDTVSIGQSLTTSDNYTTNIGTTNTVSGSGSLCVGSFSTVTGTLNFGIGSDNILTGTKNIGIGLRVYSAFSDTIGIGKALLSNANGASLIGYGVSTANRLTNSTADSLALGWNTTTPQHLFKSTGVNLTLPTSSTGLSSGDLWNDGGTVKIA